MPFRKIPWRKRFESHFVKGDGCWLWNTSTNESETYGKIWAMGMHWSAHRLSWYVYRGAIPPGIWVLHTCDMPRCVNPDHLFLGTCADNNADARKKGRLLAPYEEGAANAKLTGAQVDEIRRLYDDKGKTTEELGRAFGVAKHTIHHIVRRHTWRHRPSGQTGPSRVKNSARGPKQHLARLTTLQVCALRILHESGDYSYRRLSTMFGISEPTVAQVITRRSWKHVPHVA